mmetsp:Transcript_1473/g.2605  ORF Transcript_1473/g.2605 Transcript_1473/m.2605 type:complete len:1291 (+) Transcript_1473:74-3946(+)
MLSLSLYFCVFLALIVQGQSEVEINGGAIDMITDLKVNYTWMEIGFAGLTDTMWYNITSTATNLREDRNYSVFISLPEYGGYTNEDGFPLVPKLKGSPTRNPDGTLTFLASLIQPNDTACFKNWTIPKPLKEIIAVSWILVQNGVYNISDNMFLIDHQYMGRDNSQILFEDKPYLYHNRVVLNYTTGCDSENPDDPCTFESSDPTTVNNWACDTWFNCEKYWLHLGALQQIQTDINKFEGESMWLSIRSRNVYTDRIELLMTPHSVGPVSPFYRTYETLVPELVSYFVYEQNVRIRCLGGLHIETKIDYPITSLAKEVDFFFLYDYPPGLFGMIGTLTSVNDAATLRVFNNTPSGAFYITQEDQCYDEEVKHTANESAFTFAIGESTVSDESIGLTDCRIVYNNAIPTGQPSQEPSGEPSTVPSGEPSGEPSSVPSGAPSGVPTGVPSGVPSGVPTIVPTGVPSGVPSCIPSGEPSGEPSASPTGSPFGGPSKAPTTSPPTSEPSTFPTGEPSGMPSSVPTGAPSGIPSGVPSAVPSGAPSAVPSGVPSGSPSGIPTSEPSSSPTITPTSSPTFAPTRSPTANPTKSPTAIPTLRPTSTPTWDTPKNCTFQFLLVDTFGDGWVDVWANFTTTDMHPFDYEEVQSELHQPNCTYKVVSFLSLSCSIEVSMMNGLLAGNGNVDGAITPWENYWHINFKGTRYVGGVDSFWKVKYGRVMAAENMVNYDPEDQRNDCHECKHPKPKRAKELFGDDGNPHHTPRGGGNDDKASGISGTDDRGGGARKLGGKDDDVSDKDDDKSGSGKDDDKSSSGKDDDNSSGGSGGRDEVHNRLGGTGDMPAAKGKPKPKRPPPPYLVQIALYDEIGDGYYDDSGEFDTLYSRSDYDDIDLKTTFPNILAYPKYYIMTKDRKKLIKSPGSICPKRGYEYCEEALPYRGKFIFRFAGFEPWKTDPLEGKDEATWRFCGMSGGINEEFEFEMRNGQCFPVTNTLTDELYCQLGFESAIEFALTMNVTGAFADIGLLTERDTALLEQQVAQLFPSNVKAVVAAVDHSTANSFRVEMKVTAIAEKLGYHGSNDDDVEAMMQEIPSLFGKFLDNGLLLSNLMDDLDKVAMSENDPLRRAETISLLSVDLLDVHFQDPNAGGAFALPFAQDGGNSAPVQMISSYTPSTSGQNQLELSGTVGVVSLASLVIVVMAVAVVATRSSPTASNEQTSSAMNSITSMLNRSPKTHSLLPSNSVHDDTGGVSSDDAGEVQVPRKIVPGDTRKQEAVQYMYEDDLDIYNKYMDKKTFL